ncbi:expressed unknown protein [Seminavis robusta]|uniref:Uncharacterized protein n=1 Tax=Seminavis robusta TaxID=568900 RepID=A0A9N8EEJ4_9STRA|nr:expressed unknown protein [Seminavis robusta]|eukprot:Sro1066_g237330.1 n/a (279) ;mRNA; f:29776-30612
MMMTNGPLHLFFQELYLASYNDQYDNEDEFPVVEAPVLIMDNAGGHSLKTTEEDKHVPMVSMRRASSTGSLGIKKSKTTGRRRKKKSKDLNGSCRWDSGTSSSLEQQAPNNKVLVEPSEEDIEGLQWMISSCTRRLTRGESALSLDEAMDDLSLSSTTSEGCADLMGGSSSSSRWSSTPAPVVKKTSNPVAVAKKDGAAKLPRRKRSSTKDTVMDQPCKTPVRKETSLSPKPRLTGTVKAAPFADLLTALDELEVDNDVGYFLSSKHMEIAPELFRAA